MSSIRKTSIIASITIVLAVTLLLSPLMIGEDVLAKKHKKSKHNHASQGIGQSQSSSQNSQCVSGGSTLASCNNINLQFQSNEGNLALAQQ